MTRKIDLLIVVILLVSLYAVYNLYSQHYVNSIQNMEKRITEENPKRRTQRSLDVLIQLEGEKLDRTLNVVSVEGAKYNLRDILSNGKYLILYCKDVNDASVRKLFERIRTMKNIDNCIVLTPKSKANVVFASLRPRMFLLTSDYNGLKFESDYFFILNKDWTKRKVFIPNIENDYGSSYLEKIDTLLN